MGVISYNEADVKTLARLLRAEAEGEGVLRNASGWQRLCESCACGLFGF